jgi:shikimate dehydrogenase
VAHSLSPTLHEAGYRAAGLTDWTYAAHDVGVAELAHFVAGLDATYRGLSLTMPLKEVAFDVAASVTRTAQATGSVNTLVRRDDGAWDGHNTDVRGIEAALADAPHDGSAFLLGSGATARSAIVALAGLGVQRLVIGVRDVSRPETLRLAVHSGMTVKVAALSGWTAEHRDQLVVSTLPPEGAQAAATAFGAGRHGGTLMDVVYANWPTPLGQAAARAGMTVISGLDMLVYQAAEQFRLFTGHPAPVQAMYAAGRRALAR